MHFEVLTLGTIAVIFVLTFVGLALGKREREALGIRDEPVAELAVPPGVEMPA